MHRIYAASLVPCEIRLPTGKLLHISDSPLVDVCGSYLEDRDGAKIPQGLRVINDGIYTSLSEAEEEAKNLAMAWAALLCFTMGVKTVFPRPLCLLERLDKKGRYRLRRYFYDVLPVQPSRPLSIDMVASIRERLSSLVHGEESERVALAMRWYLVGLGESDDAMRFLAYWIGLEAIGDLLHRRLHIADRAACPICDHQAGLSHRGRRGGMKHVLSVVSGKPQLFEELDHARDKIFHGLKDLQQLFRVIVDNVALLETALGRGILEVITPQGSGESTSAAEPFRTSNVPPQFILEATLIDLSEEERNSMLYGSPFIMSSEIVSLEDAEDDSLLLEANHTLHVPTFLRSRLVDSKLRVISPLGMEIREIGELAIESPP